MNISFLSLPQPKFGIMLSATTLWGMRAARYVQVWIFFSFRFQMVIVMSLNKSL